MHDAIDSLGSQDLTQAIGLSQVDLMEWNIGGHGRAMALSQVVDDRHTSAGCAEVTDCM
jgi:hypothetical protein